MERGQDSNSGLDGPFAILSRLVADARALAQAEIAVQRAALACRIEIARPAIVGLVLAIFLAQAAITCLLVMLGLALAERIGPLWAGAIVAGAALAIAGIAAWLAMRRLKRLSDIRGGGSE